MTHENFKRSPIFQNALRTEDTMMTPAQRRIDRQVGEASKRLDHLIRNALNFDLDGPQHLDVYIICAIKAFIRLLDSTVIGSGASLAVVNEILPKMQFCRELAAASDQERLANSWQIATAEWFEEKIARYRPMMTKATMADMVYLNPFRHMGLHEPTLRLYHEMRRYWR